MQVQGRGVERSRPRRDACLFISPRTSGRISFGALSLAPLPTLGRAQSCFHCTGNGGHRSSCASAGGSPLCRSRGSLLVPLFNPPLLRVNPEDWFTKNFLSRPDTLERQIFKPTVRDKASVMRTTIVSHDFSFSRYDQWFFFQSEALFRERGEWNKGSPLRRCHVQEDSTWFLVLWSRIR